MLVPCKACETRLVAFTSNVDGKLKYYCEKCKLVYAEDLKSWSIPDCKDCGNFIHISRQKFIYRDGTTFYGEALYCRSELLIREGIKSTNMSLPRDGRVLIGKIYWGCKGQQYFTLKTAPIPKEPEKTKFKNPLVGSKPRHKVVETQRELF